jgi:hypothetical protein
MTMTGQGQHMLPELLGQEASNLTTCNKDYVLLHGSGSQHAPYDYPGVGWLMHVNIPSTVAIPVFLERLAVSWQPPGVLAEPSVAFVDVVAVNDGGRELADQVAEDVGDQVERIEGAVALAVNLVQHLA